MKGHPIQPGDAPTPRQFAVLDFIARFFAERGFRSKPAPTPPRPEPAPLSPLPAETPAIGLRSRPLFEVAEETQELPRLLSGQRAFDRVLGGGLVPGSLVLLGGDPGVGKSTLLLQVLDGLARAGGGPPRPVLYVTGEETLPQAAQRARRLGATAPGLHALAETRLDAIVEEARELKAAVLAIDSIQTVQTRAGGRPGTLRQVRGAITALMPYAKKHGLAVLLICHVTKGAQLAGPKAMEHLVDVVLHFDGDAARRSLWPSKNRFGSTEPTGTYLMGAAGLVEIRDPQESAAAREAEPSPPGQLIDYLDRVAAHQRPQRKARRATR